ncbi:hypothetical protein [Streptomyces buecherae]|uniref:SCO3933 family regulatory protein n=1 Tax=Streptomyces buecherae TaxID=2763006 RepID=UPI003676103D
MQQIPVDTGRLEKLMCVVAPEPRANRDTGQIRVDREGRHIYAVGVLVRKAGERRAWVLEIAVPGDPVLEEDDPVEIEGLIATPWQMEGRSGVSWRAERIVRAKGKATGSAPAGPDPSGPGRKGATATSG